MLFSEPKIPQFKSKISQKCSYGVSVLFSEPKIPQSSLGAALIDGIRRFQCSSASRKFLNSSICKEVSKMIKCFSALQRAENSSILVDFGGVRRLRKFQCSSASRKFLNSSLFQTLYPRLEGFSALQRAENSSI